jgi:hypothetical protein
MDPLNGIEVNQMSMHSTIKKTLVNEWTVGGSLLLCGVAFWTTRFSDIMAYPLFTIPSVVPLLGNTSVTVGKCLALIPFSMGVAVLARAAKPTTDKIPVVDKVADALADVAAVVSVPATAEVKPTPVVIESSTTEVSMAAEDSGKSASGTPKQQLWRSCVKDAGGDMALAKQLRSEREAALGL